MNSAELRAAFALLSNSIQNLTLTMDAHGTEPPRTDFKKIIETIRLLQNMTERALDGFFVAGLEVSAEPISLLSPSSSTLLLTPSPSPEHPPILTPSSSPPPTLESTWTLHTTNILRLVESYPEEVGMKKAEPKVTIEMAQIGALRPLDPKTLHATLRGGGVHCILMRVVSPMHFWLSPKAKDAEYCDLQLKIQSLAAILRLEGYKMDPPTPGTPCLARYSEDKMWYRAVVKKGVGTKEADVDYVDYGNNERVPLNRLLPMPSSLTGLPIGSIYCTLPGMNAYNAVQSKDRFNRAYNTDEPVFAHFLQPRKGDETWEKWEVDLMDDRGVICSGLYNGERQLKTIEEQ